MHHHHHHHHHFILNDGDIVDEGWCYSVKWAMTTAAFEQFTREYADTRGQPASEAKRALKAEQIKAAAAGTEIAARCSGCADVGYLPPPRDMARIFDKLTPSCVIEGRILVKELEDALQTAIQLPVVVGIPFALATAIFRARQRHFYEAGVLQCAAAGAALKRALVHDGGEEEEEADIEALIIQQLADEDAREDARCLTADLDVCLEKVMEAELSRYRRGSDGSRGNDGSRGSDGSSSGSITKPLTTHAEWIKGIQWAAGEMERYMERFTRNRFFVRDARYRIETALKPPALEPERTKRQFDVRLGCLIAAEIRRFDARMMLMSDRPVEPDEVAEAVTVCRKKMMAAGGALMTPSHQATLSGLIYALMPADPCEVALFCADEFVE